MICWSESARGGGKKLSCNIKQASRRNIVSVSDPLDLMSGDKRTPGAAEVQQRREKRHTSRETVRHRRLRQRHGPSPLHKTFRRASSW